MLSRLSIRSKITAVLVILLVAMAGLGLFAIRKMQAINANAVDIQTNWMPSVRVLLEIKYDIARYRAQETQHILSSTPEDMDKYEKRLAEFRDWSEGAILGLNPVRTPAETEHMEASRLALDAYFTELMAARRAKPEDDLVSDMVQLQAEGAPLSDIELRINLLALLIGGNLTTTDLIGNGVRLFLLNPAQKAKLVADPALVPQAVEEILRYEGPVDITGRVLSGERAFGGCPMHEGQSVTVALRGANRDPDVFERPDEFDITRKGIPHMSFGGGAHICIGAPLARMEAIAFFSVFFQRFPTLKLVDEPPQWRALPFFRGLERLRVKV